MPRDYRRPRAHRVMDYAGRPMYSVPVRVLFNDSQQCATVAEARFDVIARDATDAANWARDQVATRPETEVYAWGPKGGKVHRYIGWESAIFAEMCRRSDARPVQPRLPLEVAS